MRALSKSLLGILLLTLTAASWAACPEGQKQTYKGCDAIEEKASEEQQEVKEVTAEILELSGFVAEEVQFADDAAEVLEVLEIWPDDLGRETTINVGYSSYEIDTDTFFAKNNLLFLELSGGGFSLPVRFNRVRVLVRSHRSHDLLFPDTVMIEINKSQFPSIRDSSDCGKEWMDKGYRWHFEFSDPRNQPSNNCRFQMLTKEDQEKLWLLVNNIDRIVEYAADRGGSTVPDGAGPNYWLDLANSIRTEAPNSLYR